MTITIELTETEYKAMQYAALSVQDWADNALTNRARIAIDEIVQLTVQKCLETSTQIPGTKEEMVQLAFDNEWVKTAEQRNTEAVLTQGI